MRAVVDRAPKGFGAEPSKYRYDVLSLKSPLTEKRVLARVPTKEVVDRIWPELGDLYWSREEHHDQARGAPRSAQLTSEVVPRAPISRSPPGPHGTGR
jgi:hypothetical protein